MNQYIENLLKSFSIPLTKAKISVFLLIYIILNLVRFALAHDIILYSLYLLVRDKLLLFFMSLMFPIKNFFR